MIKSYRDLEVWQLAITLVDRVYEITREFPKQEMFGLTSQIRRSAVSIAANLAEGSARNSRKDFAQFVAISRGSLAELETHLYVVKRQGFITGATHKQLESRMDRISKMLMGLRNALLNTSQAPGTRHQALTE